ncbi:glycosyltransferase family 2 protein [Proteus mirabilis]|uniref:glycosyltransferase family 2 protein n=1 Tax=Morganellaceae TaxID=1903414 RepID=UPI0034E51CC0
MSDITVIIPYYNSTDTIERALDSVYCQTVSAAAIIIVDDNSRHSSLEYLYQLIKRKYDLTMIPIDVIVQEKNNGPAKARNIGWNLAKTSFIAFLDSDDSWHHKKLEIQLKYFLDDPSLIMCGHKMKVITADSCHHLNIEDLNYKTISKNLILSKNYFQTPSVIIRNNIQNRFPEYQRFSEDYYLWIDIILDNHKSIYLSEPLAFCHKPFYGSSGLSANLLSMEKSELKNYLMFYKKNKINLSALVFFSTLSICKFLVRLIKTRLK